MRKKDRATAISNIDCTEAVSNDILIFPNGAISTPNYCIMMSRLYVVV